MKITKWLLFLTILGCNSDKIINSESKQSTENSIGTYIDNNFSLPPITNVIVSDTAQLIYMYKGSPIPGNTVVWATSDSSIATISSTGHVSFLNESSMWPKTSSTVIITGTYKSHTDAAVFIVKWPYIKNLSIMLNNCFANGSVENCGVVFDFDVFKDSTGTIPMINYLSAFWVRTSLDPTSGIFGNSQPTDGAGHYHLQFNYNGIYGKTYYPNFCASVGADVATMIYFGNGQFCVGSTYTFPDSQ